jgi:hypothetical protein
VYALLALRLKPVDQQRQVHRSALRPVPLRIRLQRIELVLVDQVAVVEQPPDQSRLAVVHAPAGDEAEQVH